MLLTFCAVSSRASSASSADALAPMSGENVSRHWVPGYRQRCGQRCGHGLVRTDLDAALGDHGAVGLVDDTVDLGEVVRVRDDLIAADNVLVEAGSC